MTRVDYDHALAALREALRFGIHPSLDGIVALCDAMGRPQDAFSAVQVTGTNGKTSTSRYIAAALGAQGLRTGLYTSPELERYPERIEIDGEVVSDHSFATAVGAVLAAAEGIARFSEEPGTAPTEFELLTAAALWLFRESKVEAAVLEVGMGGRWDATSVVSPRVAVITGVGIDHAAILGSTLEAIATEKAAIIREGSVAVLGEGTEVMPGPFEAAARASDARVVRPRAAVTARPQSPTGETVFDLVTPRAVHNGVRLVAPAYQAANAATAIVAAEEFCGRGLDGPSLRRALRATRSPGRFEILREDPVVIVDGSHNPQAAGVLAEAIADAWPDSARRPVVALGVLDDKDAHGMIASLSAVAARFVVVEPDSPRAMGAPRLAGIVESVTGRAPDVLGPITHAVPVLLGGEGDVVITGSLVTAGQARAAVRDVMATE